MMRPAGRWCCTSGLGQPEAWRESIDAFGFRRFTHYRIRALLYAGQPNWTLLNGLTPR